MGDSQLQLDGSSISKEVAKRQKQDAVVVQNTDLIALAIDRNVDPDKLGKIIALVTEQEERKARALYDIHYAEMQSEFLPATRSKKGYDYWYAPIEELQKQYGPIISRHGFSYRWREEAIESGKRVYLKISGWGHSEETFFDVPKIDGTKQMNPIQVAGAMSTYGRRYTFIAGFGIAIEDEDRDGDSGSRSDDDQEQLKTMLKSIGESTWETLGPAQTMAMKAFEQDIDAKKMIVEAVRKRKETLNATKNG